MEDGNWILYAAMVVIAFISWVFNRIQEATAARRRASEIEARRQDRIRRGLPPDELEEEEEEDFLLDEEQYYDETGSPKPEPAQADEPLRQLFEALGGKVAEAPPPPKPTQAPPPKAAPLPPKFEKPASAASQLSQEERDALERVKARRKKSSRRRRRGTSSNLSIADMLRDPDGVRKAVVLREVLDRPRSVRPLEFGQD